MSSISGIGSSTSTNAWASQSSTRASRAAEMFAKVDTDADGSVNVGELDSLLSDISQKTGVTFSADAQALLKQMDTDGNGTLSQDELDKGMKSIMPKPDTMQFAAGRSQGGPDDLFSKIDTDGDGSVSKEELQALSDKMAADHGKSSTDVSEKFKELDTDGDGKLSEAEFAAGRPQGGPPPQASDAAGTAAASGAVAAGAAGAAGGSGVQTYDPLDTNEDGVVSAAERMAGGKSTDPLKALIESADANGDGSISADEIDAFVSKLSTALQSQSSDNDSSSKTASNAAGSADKFDEALQRLADVMRQEYAKFSAEGVQASNATSSTSLSTFA